MAFQADSFSDSWSPSDPDLTDSARSQILLVSADTGQSQPAAPSMRLEPLVEPDSPFDPAPLHEQYGEDADTPSMTYNGETFYLYYGELHEHSDISICNRCGDQSLDENYQCRRDINRLDFVAMTDHGYNIVPYLWNYSAKMVRANHDQGRLVTFLGEEWTSSFEDYDENRRWGYYGHRNLVFADPYFPKWWSAFNGDSPSDLWAELRGMKADFVQIPHQLADTGNVPIDWDYADEAAQPVAEIFQTRGSYEYAGAPRHAGNATGEPGNYIQDAWARGLKIGVIASPTTGRGWQGGGLGTCQDSRRHPRGYPRPEDLRHDRRPGPHGLPRQRAPDGRGGQESDRARQGNGGRCIPATDPGNRDLPQQRVRLLDPAGRAGSVDRLHRPRAAARSRLLLPAGHPGRRRDRMVQPRLARTVGTSPPGAVSRPGATS